MEQEFTIPTRVLKVMAKCFKNLQQDQYRMEYDAKTNSLRLCAVDVAHVCMTEMTIPMALVPGWDIAKPGPFFLDEDVPSALVKRSLTDPHHWSIKMEATKDGRSYESTVVDSNAHGKVVTFNTVAEAIYPKVPNMVYTAQVAVATTTVQRAVSFLRDMSDHLHIHATEDRGLTKLATKMDEKKKHTMSGEYYLGTANLKGGVTHAKSHFPMDYFSDIIGTFDATVFPSVTIDFASDLPMRVTGVSQDGFVLSQMLAPRIETD